jgi:FGGY-family pentulose kinase
LKLPALNIKPTQKDGMRAVRLLRGNVPHRLAGMATGNAGVASRASWRRPLGAAGAIHTAHQSSSQEMVMAEGPYLMGIDYGTGGVRVGLFDRAGTPAVFHSVEFGTSHPRPGQAEQDPHTWWTSLVEAVKGALQQSGVAAEEIAGIGVDTTASTVLAMDRHDRPLRPAIMWMDVRATDEAARIQESGDPALKYNGFASVSAEWGLPKCMWLKNKEPITWEAAAHICDAGDWLINRLTGEWVASVNIAAAKFYYDRDAGGFPHTLLASVGIEDFLDKYPQNVLNLGEVVGGLRKDVADELGLKADTPVTQGGIDGFVGMIGLGVVEPGRLAFITGSSHALLGQAAEPIHGRGFWGAYTDAVIPGQYTVEAGQVSTGSIVAWFKNKFAVQANEEARRRGVDPYVVLNEMARDVPAGSDGLVVLDYFQGNRTPHTDPMVRGMIWGLSLAHGEAHLFRAIIEGICYGTEDIFRTFRNYDFKPTLNIVSGGPTKSDLWMQIHADVSNVPISLTKVGEGPVLGGAILGAVGGGVYPDIPTAVDNMVHYERTIEPDPARHEEYQFYVDRYIETYERMKEPMHKTTRHVAASVPVPVEA